MREIVNKLVTSDVALLLLDLCAATKVSSSVRSTAMSGLTYILWIAPTLTPRVLEYKDAFQTLVLDGLVRHGSLHIQRNSLNVLNVVLSDVSVFEGEDSKNSVAQNRMRQNVVKRQGHIVLDRLCKILETNTNEIVRAKAALSISLLLIRRHDLMLRACVKLHLPAVLTGAFNLVGDHQRFSARGEEDEDEDDDVSYLRQSIECLVSVVANLSTRFTNVALHLHDRRGESKYHDEYVVICIMNCRECLRECWRECWRECRRECWRECLNTHTHTHTGTVWTERDLRSEKTGNETDSTRQHCHVWSF